LSEGYDLKDSVAKLGRLSPIIKDANGNIIDGEKRERVLELIQKLKESRGKITDRGHTEFCRLMIAEFEKLGYSQQFGYACDLIFEREGSEPIFLEIKTNDSSAGNVEKAVGQLLREQYLRQKKARLIAFFSKPVRASLSKFANHHGIETYPVGNY